MVLCWCCCCCSCLAVLCADHCYTNKRGAGLSLMVEVADDDLVPENNGRWHLSIDPATSRATCVAAADAAGAAADAAGGSCISLGIRALATLWSGLRAPSELASFGMLTAGTQETLALADVIFSTAGKAPHLLDHF